ncbi:alpha/beta fold hydrolase [Evansella clarkii]|uniref:alpha/beta fold hydrolase n=1 Tax=Evansella clarkii TaxID=79879 RepID=UPI000996F0DC|nr:alpha/beta fold hydrolase [Evansella clarkii]
MWKQIYVKTARGQFEVFVSGSGEPLCVIHLYSEFNERGNYFANMFTDSFRVYLINLKETGNSNRAKTKEELSMNETVKDLEAIREALCLKEWNYAGHSTGGMLGLVYGSKHPKSLKRLLAGGGAASNDYMKHKESIYSSLNPRNKRLKELFFILKSKESTKEERIQAGREWTEMSLFDPERFDEYFSKPSSGRVVQKRLDYFSYEELPEYDIRKDITKIKTPTFIFCGKHDSQCPLIYSQEIHQLVPLSKLYIFENSNHFPFLEEKLVFEDMINDYVKVV